ncbi:hypothetical protein ACHQM5_011614 [Ranunculus cassubicifolius]
METVEICPVKQEALEELPPLFQIAESKSISGFDSIQGIESTNPSSPSTSLPAAANGFESVPFRNDDAASQSNQTLNVRAVSISMPCSPLGERRVLFADSAPPYANKGVADHSAITIENPKHVKFHSQPISYVDVIVEPMVPPLIPPLVPQLVPQLKNPRIDRLKDKRFDSFKTWSGKLERQLSHIGGRYTEPEPEADASQNTTVQPLPVDRYFDALEGPELETLRPSEELLLPEDKQWPFLLRYPISSFGICLGTSSQAILWKALATSTSTSFLHVNLNISLVLWCISIALVAVVTVIYLLKVIFYFEAIRREYYHPIRVNFFFAPWIALLFLALGVPPSIVKNLHPSTWYILMAPLFCLELKIYGQWMSGGRRRLSKVANPSNHLAVVGNFVGALLGATMGLKEGPIFFFAVGLAHYTVLFVTLYQRLPTNETLPKDLHPVFFLFVAAPSVASMAWGRIQESFDYGSRIAYFIALFLYISLAVRVNFFRGFKFSLAWWAYTFPMTGAAIATIRYANEVKHPVAQSLAVILSYPHSNVVACFHYYSRLCTQGSLSQ